MPKYIGIVLIVFLLFALSGCGELPAVVPEGSTPPASTDAGAGVTPDATGADATQPTDTSALSPDDTPAETPSPAPSDTPAPSTSPAPTATPSSGGTLSIDPVIGKVIPTEGLAIRAKASETAEVLGQIPADGEFTVLQVESGKKWLIVQYKGVKGFVPSKSVSIGSGSDRVCTVFCDSVLNVRSGAGTKNSVIGTVGSGASLIVLGKTVVDGSTWYKVDVGDSTGYIVAKYCRISG